MSYPAYVVSDISLISLPDTSISFLGEYVHPSVPCKAQNMGISKAQGTKRNMKSAAEQRRQFFCFFFEKTFHAFGGGLPRS